MLPSGRSIWSCVAVILLLMTLPSTAPAQPALPRVDEAMCQSINSADQFFHRRLNRVFTIEGFRRALIAANRPPARVNQLVERATNLGNQQRAQCKAAGLPKPAGDPLAGDWKLDWQWPITNWIFKGTVASAGDRRYTFKGQEQRNPRINVECSLRGPFGASGVLECQVTRPHPGKPGITLIEKSWINEGAFLDDRHPISGAKIFSFRGRGLAGDATTSHRDNIFQLLVMPPSW
jgi:hypothetical protein